MLNHYAETVSIVKKVLNNTQEAYILSQNNLIDVFDCKHVLKIVIERHKDYYIFLCM